MARMTKREEAEFVRVYYGIHTPTGTVRDVWLQRNGKLVMTGKDLTTTTAFVGPGRSAESELVVVFNLSDVFSASIGQVDSEGTKRQLDELRAKAAAMNVPR
jgi:hypothetical protein